MRTSYDTQALNIMYNVYSYKYDNVMFLDTSQLFAYNLDGSKVSSKHCY